MCNNDNIAMNSFYHNILNENYIGEGYSTSQANLKHSPTMIKPQNNK